jgi:glycosyltransferase involved in cell wall biosynthesis
MMADISYRAQPGGFESRQLRSDPVAILLCTFNGAPYLPLQLASFEAQDFADWRLIASDDGSEDDTWALLAEFQRKHGAGRVQLLRGPGKGVFANFMSLICDSALKSEFYALSDQDDIWAPDKLSRALSFLNKASADLPSVYCSRVRMIDEQGTEIGLTPVCKKPPHFRNALVQNIAIGNTMVFNEQTRRLVMQAGADVNAAVHDWWIYLATTAVGGSVFYDPYPSVYYRLHARNLIGANNNRLLRGRMLLNRFKIWNDANVRALERIQGAMLQENRRTFDLFRRSRTSSLLPRLFGLLRSGVYRETKLDNLGLLVAALTGKI